MLLRQLGERLSAKAQRTACVCCVAVALAAAAHAQPAKAQRETLFSFYAPAGIFPDALARASDGRLYGAARDGGRYGKGVVFVVSGDGTAEPFYTLTGHSDGMTPGQLVAGDDGSLYGISALPPLESGQGQTNLFRLTLDGTFEVLQVLPGTIETVTLARGHDGRVYGSSQGAGALFSISAGVIQTLYSFAQGVSANQLTADANGDVYGTTLSSSGDASQLFRLSPRGAFEVLAVLPSLLGAHTDEPPVAATATALTFGPNGVLYLAANKHTQHFLLRYRRGGSLTPVAELDASVTALVAGPAADVLGATDSGGTFGRGRIFHLTQAGLVETLYSFLGQTDGAAPLALLVTDGEVYGVAADGGAGSGTLFRLHGGQAFESLFAFTYPEGAAPSGLLLGPEGSFYGSAHSGGPFGAGTLWKAETNGDVQVIHAFTGGGDGAIPTALSLGIAGDLYGRTLLGGAWGHGTLFHATRDGELTTLVHFTAQGQGDGPPLIQLEDGSLMGADQAGNGHVFRVRGSNQIENVYTFPGLHSRDGATPNTFIRGADGKLYGTTYGTSQPHLRPDESSGTIFRVNAVGEFSTLYAFRDDDNALGVIPRSVVWGSDGQLYGTTSNLRSSCDVLGGLWRLNPVSFGIEQLYAFDEAAGMGAMGLIELTPGALSGLMLGGTVNMNGQNVDTNKCGVARNSSLFSYQNGELPTLAELPYALGENGVGPELARTAQLSVGPDDDLYAVTVNGGSAGTGELFIYPLPHEAVSLTPTLEQP